MKKGFTIRTPYQSYRHDMEAFEIEMVNKAFPHRAKGNLAAFGWLSIPFIVLILLRLGLRAVRLFTYLITPLELLDSSTAMLFNLGISIVVIFYVCAVIGVAKSKIVGAVLGILGAGLDLVLGVLGTIIVYTLYATENYSLLELNRYFSLGMDYYDVFILIIMIILSIIIFKDILGKNRRIKLIKSLCPNCKTRMNPRDQLCPNCGAIKN